MAISNQPPEVKAGDVVRLKSGGQAMTVERVIQAQRPFAACRWMDAKATVRNAFLDLEAIERVSPDAPSPDLAQRQG
jgi:uncharacterized protein YodC (DUF2158 family)